MLFFCDSGLGCLLLLLTRTQISFYGRAFESAAVPSPPSSINAEKASYSEMWQPSAAVSPHPSLQHGGTRRVKQFCLQAVTFGRIKEQHNNVSTWEISSADIDCLRCFRDQSQLCITVPQFFSQVSFRCLTGDVTPHGSEWEHAFFPAVKWLKGLNNSEKRKWCCANRHMRQETLIHQR